MNKIIISIEESKEQLEEMNRLYSNKHSEITKRLNREYARSSGGSAWKEKSKAQSLNYELQKWEQETGFKEKYNRLRAISNGIDANQYDEGIEITKCANNLSDKAFSTGNISDHRSAAEAHNKASIIAIRDHRYSDETKHNKKYQIHKEIIDR